MTLLEAVRAGDIEAVKRAIAGGADVNEAYDEYGLTPLGKAAFKGFEEVADALLDAGADVNRKWGTENVVHSAVMGGSVRILKRVVDAGADVNAFHPSLGAPLHLAAGRLSLEMVQLLLANGADPHLEIELMETTPLMSALERFHPNTPEIHEACHAVALALANAGSGAPPDEIPWDDVRKRVEKSSS